MTELQLVHTAEQTQGNVSICAIEIQVVQLCLSLSFSFSRARTFTSFSLSIILFIYFEILEIPEYPANSGTVLNGSDGGMAQTNSWRIVRRSCLLVENVISLFLFS